MARLFRYSALLAAALLSLSGLQGQAQYPYPPYPVVNRGPGAVLSGQADVINATGDLFVQQEQARIQREAANQAKLDTKKKSFDLRLYENALTPTYGERLAKDKALFLKRIMSNPIESEITNGTAQNTMLPFLYNLAMQGAGGSPVKLDPQMMKLINVTAGTSGTNIGVLRQGDLDWPIVLRGNAHQKKLTSLLPQAVAAATDNTLTLAQYNGVAKEVSAMYEDLRKQFHKEEIDGGMFLEGKRFIDSLDSAVKALRQPSAAKLLKGSIAATGHTVPELVAHMTQQGLKFTAATPGVEAPYYGLYSAMVAYGNESMDSQAFKRQFEPTNLDQQYYQKSVQSGSKFRGP